MSTAPPPPPSLTLDSDKVTDAMRESLEDLRSCLLCPLCNQVFVKATTLACSHTFCASCIENYTMNSWNCPFPGCGLPVTVRGNRDGSYLKPNPNINTVVTSFGKICKVLNEAPTEWWNTPIPDGLTQNEGEESEVDLQANQQASPVLSDRGATNRYSPSTEAMNASPMSQGTEPFNQSESQQSSVVPRTQDSQTTQKFEMSGDDSGSSTASPAWMDTIIEEENGSPKKRNNSCVLQSPGLSPIAPIQSQQPDEDDEKATPRAIPARAKSADTQPTEIDQDTTPRVLLVSSLNASDKAIVSRCIDEGRLELVLDSIEDEVDVQDHKKTRFLSRLDKHTFALCSNAEIETGDGFLVERTFEYFLALACGLPIMYIRHLQDQEGSLFPSRDTKKNLVIGDAESTEWMAPQRALENAMSCKEAPGTAVGTTLLQGYTVYLYGEFDSIASSRSGRKKRARTTASDSANTGSRRLYSLERVQTLLECCRARVRHLHPDNKLLVPDSSTNSKVLVLVRTNPHARDWRSAQKFVTDSMEEGSSSSSPPIISANWLLDSISDFEVKPFDDYTHEGTKRQKQTRR